MNFGDLFWTMFFYMKMVKGMKMAEASTVEEQDALTLELQRLQCL